MTLFKTKSLQGSTDTLIAGERPAEMSANISKSNCNKSNCNLKESIMKTLIDKFAALRQRGVSFKSNCMEGIPMKHFIKFILGITFSLLSFSAMALGPLESVTEDTFVGAAYPQTLGFSTVIYSPSAFGDPVGKIIFISNPTRCTATLVAQDKVLMVGHCIVGSEIERLFFGNFTVYYVTQHPAPTQLDLVCSLKHGVEQLAALKAQDPSNVSGHCTPQYEGDPDIPNPDVEFFKVSEVYMHEQVVNIFFAGPHTFDRLQENRHDIAMLILEEKFTIVERDEDGNPVLDEDGNPVRVDVMPATVPVPGYLDNVSNFVRANMVSVGYGTFNETDGNGVRRYGEEGIVSIGPGWVHPQFANNDVNQCAGDSGGPRFLGSIEDTNSGSPLLIGLHYGDPHNSAGICGSMDRAQRIDSAGDAEMVQCLLNDENGTSVEDRCNCDHADPWKEFAPGFCQVQALKLPDVFPFTFYFDPDTQDTQ